MPRLRQDAHARRDVPVRKRTDDRRVLRSHQRDRDRYACERGTCTLDANGFGYRGNRTSFSIPLRDLPAMPFSCNAEFETYHNGDLYYFYPTENPRQAVRWALLVDRRKEMQHETQD